MLAARANHFQLPRQGAVIGNGYIPTQTKNYCDFQHTGARWRDGLLPPSCHWFCLTNRVTLIRFSFFEEMLKWRKGQ